MKTIRDLVPEEEDLLALQPEEVGGLILQILASARPEERSILNRNNFIITESLKLYPRNKQDILKQVLMEGWAWLESEGLIAADPEQQGNWVFVTRRGLKASRPEAFRSYRSSSAFKKDLLHPLIIEKAWSSYLRGDFDSAVFIAFREVEIRVRELSKLPDETIGVDLMRKAFGNSGSLTPIHLPKAEQDSLTHLLAGAIGWFKNPLSHKHVGIGRVDYAAQSLMFASHLLYLVETMHMLS